jgi:hypothetical protein
MRTHRLITLGVLVLAVLGVLVASHQLFAQTRTVTRVGIVAKPKVYNGACPADLEFVATIFVSRHPVAVEYQWERSDGAKGERRRIEIRSAGQGVTEMWRVGAPGKHMEVWERLHVLAPTGISSAEATVRVNCR